jgi:Uma2 family endonuclease
VGEFTDMKITEDTVVQPDALIVSKEIRKPFLDFAPALVVEILSPSTALKDRNTKLHLYEQFGIPYFVIVDMDRQEIECYQLSEKKQYSTEPFDAKSPFTLHLNEDCSIPVTFANIWE